MMAFLFSLHHKVLWDFEEVTHMIVIENLEYAVIGSLMTGLTFKKCVD